MVNVMSAIDQTVSITLFNRGLAGKIFNEVKESGAKVVMKNNAAECVLISPEEYKKLIDEVNDARLLAEAVTRMNDFGNSKVIPAENLNAELGITEEALEAVDEVEFE